MAVISELAVNVVARTGGLERGLKKAKRSFSSFKSTIISGMAALGGGISLAWVGKLAADMETTEVRFATMMGNASQAKNMLSDLDKFAAKTPFQFDDLANGAANLMAFGVGAGDVMTALQHLGDVASGTPATLDQIVNVFGKVQAKGKASMEEMNRLMEAGVPILDVLAKQFGVTKAEIIKMTSGGKVGFEDFQQAIFSMSDSGGMFFNMIDKQSKTLAGAISTLKDNFAKLGREIGTVLLPFMQAVVTVVLDAVQGWNSLSAGFKKTVMVLGAMAVTFGVALKSMMVILKITKAISIAQAAQNVIVAVGQALAGNWKAIAVAGVAAVAVGAGMMAVLSKQKDTLAEQGEQDNKNTKAVEGKLNAIQSVTAEQEKQLDLQKKQNEAMKNRASSIAESVLTPMEKAVKAQQEINNLRAKGFLDVESARRKTAEIEKGLITGTKRTPKAEARRSSIGAAEFRTQAGFSAAQQGQKVQLEIKRIAERNLIEQRRQNVLLAELNQKASQTDGGICIQHNFGP